MLSRLGIEQIHSHHRHQVVMFFHCELAGTLLPSRSHADRIANGLNQRVFQDAAAVALRSPQPPWHRGRLQRLTAWPILPSSIRLYFVHVISPRVSVTSANVLLPTFAPAFFGHLFGGALAVEAVSQYTNSHFCRQFGQHRWPAHPSARTWPWSCRTCGK